MKRMAMGVVLLLACRGLAGCAGAGPAGGGSRSDAGAPSGGAPEGGAPKRGALTEADLQEPWSGPVAPIRKSPKRG